jgi:protocatechuate 3,4-dioxygenase beta subunit
MFPPERIVCQTPRPRRPRRCAISLSSACLSGSTRRTNRYSALLYAQCHDADEAAIRQTEGPYFKPSSPQRADLVEPDTKARLVEINGQVLTRSCRPVERAFVDLWHADERGEYDNAGFRFMSW